MNWKFPEQTEDGFISEHVNNKTITNEMNVHSCTNMHFIYNLRMKCFILNNFDF